jgi:alpha-N-arabinofuranosidase
VNRYEPRWGDAANSSRALEIIALPAGETGIRQRIYLPVHRTLAYEGSLWIKHLSEATTVSVSIRDHAAGDHDTGGRIFAEAKFDAASAD